MIRIADANPTPDCLFAFTSHPFDKEVGLQSNQPRHYDRSLGRWLNDEPDGYGASDAAPRGGVTRSASAAQSQ
jgi:RHS repeat-associated protein